MVARFDGVRRRGNARVEINMPGRGQVRGHNEYNCGRGQGSYWAVEPEEEDIFIIILLGMDN